MPISSLVRERSESALVVGTSVLHDVGDPALVTRWDVRDAERTPAGLFLPSGRGAGHQLDVVIVFFSRDCLLAARTLLVSTCTLGREQVVSVAFYLDDLTAVLTEHQDRAFVGEVHRILRLVGEVLVQLTAKGAPFGLGGSALAGFLFSCGLSPLVLVIIHLVSHHIVLRNF